MEEGYLMIEEGKGISSYYLACTNNGAVFYGAADENMQLLNGWKLVSVDELTLETVH